MTIATLQSAVRLLQSGQADEAKRLLADLLAREPNNADALALTGLAHAHRNENEDAARFMSRALVLNPHHAATLFNYANVLRKLGRWSDAEQAYARVIAIKPDHIEARRNRGHMLAEMKRDVDALAVLDRVPTENIQTLTLRAKLRMNADRASDAFADFELIVALDPQNWEAWNNRGILLDKVERYEDALKSYDRALALAPNDGNVLHNRGAVLLCLSRFDEALPLFEHLIATDPDHADNWSCHGVALASLMRLEEALASFEKGLELDPDSLRARNGKGMALVALGRPDKAIPEYKKAAALHVGNPMTHGNLAFAELVSGNLTDGFANYEWRRKDGPIGKSQRDYPQPEWTGENLAGKTLLLHPEQGLGDVVQFGRFVPVLAAQGAHVILETPPALTTLMRSLDGNHTIVGTGDRLPPFDLHAPLMSVAHRLDVTLETIPAAVPYLHADQTKRGAWREKLAPLKGKRVGICWSGHRIHRNDHARSIPFAAFQAALGVPDMSFISLQREVRDADEAQLRAQSNISDWMNEVSDFADTAALIAELDMVVTVDTSVAHVAGALGKPVWILITSAPDWRWLLNRQDSPWYPTARLFRQPTIGDWRSVITDVREALLKLK
ncbi:MAG: tetratricopeptide repeat protein [Alphaproteobacteria bacterium]|nr:tetratricopeptide repeat protein [Alphaproteobacteria bacterium]